MKRWLLIGVLVAVLIWREDEHRRIEELAIRYATVVAAMGNSGQFAIGENTLVSCKAKRVVVY